MKGWPPEAALRPQSPQEYVGQPRTNESLEICIEAAKRRGEAFGPCHFYGPPGTGQDDCTLVTRDGIGYPFHLRPGVESRRHPAAILTNLQERDVLFIDEIHRLPGLREACIRR